MAACACTSGSLTAFSRITQCSTWKKSWFSVKVSGVGGICDVVPIANDAIGGVLDKYDRR